MKTIDGNTLRKILISASNNLYNHYPEVDALNVFPVPDGDTGINMSLTCTSGANEIAKNESNNCYEVAKIFSRGLLMGARGNSGVITSQIFRGFANAIEGNDTIDAELLSLAFSNGTTVAYEAVMRPVEGTILTVVRESTSALSKQVEKGMPIELALEILFKEAKKSLKRTPELLPILKEVGVVDSGGTGLVYLIEGMLLASKGQFVERNESSNNSNVSSAASIEMEEEEFGYCTEFIMSLGPDSVKEPFSQKIVSNWLSEHGNSLVVVVDEDIVKVHVHTMNPGEILNYAQQFGEFLKIKIENMTEQHHNLENGANIEVHEDLVKKEDDDNHDDDSPLDEYALIAVSSGEGINDFFNEIGVNYIVTGGQTMNPSSEDFVSAIKKVHAKNVFILPNNSNILMAASQACDIVSNDELSAFVIPSKTIPQGVVAALSFDPDAKPHENFKNMKGSLKNVRSGEVTFSIRDCEIKGVKIKKGDFIGIYEKDIVCGLEDKFQCLLELIFKMVDEESSLLTIFIGEDVNRDELFPVKKKIEELFPDINIDIRDGKQPVYSFLVGIE